MCHSEFVYALQKKNSSQETCLPPKTQNKTFEKHHSMRFPA